MTGGGSGGHITPLLSLARALKKENKACKIIYIGWKGEKVEGLSSQFSAFDQVRAVPAGKFRRYYGQSFLAHLIDVRSLFLNVRDFFRLLRGIVAARRLLKKTRPDVVFSKGSFVAVPVGIAAKLLGIPIVTHDSDTVPGLANKIIGRWALVHTTGMPAGHYPYPSETIHEVGIPVDERIKAVSKELQKEFKKDLGLSADHPVLLVSGGGLGARDLNSMVIAAAPELLLRVQNLQLIHITGTKHEQLVKNKYSQVLGENQLGRVKVIGFSSEFYRLTGAADLIISRAGATTLAELAIQAKATILIPAPFLTGGHQLKNAQQLKKTGAAEVLSSDAKPEELVNTAARLLLDEARSRELGSKLGAGAHPEAADKLAELLLGIATKARASL